jgi:hypothetical protein
MRTLVADFDRAATWPSVVVIEPGGWIFDPVGYRPDLSKETQ